MLDRTAKFPSNDQGFTILEVVIAMGISVVLTFGVMQLSEIIQKSTKKAEEKILLTSQEVMVERILRRDLEGAQYSLSNSLQEDDQNRLFFDYKADGLCMDGETTCARQLTLEMSEQEGGFSQAFYLIINDDSKRGGLPKIILPAHAYSGNNYQGLNYGQGGESEVVPLYQMEYTPWRKDNLLVVYNPQYVFKDGKLPRQVAVMGWVPEDDELPTGQLIPENRYFQGFDIRSGKKITNERDLFGYMPYEVALASYIKVVAVKIIRYRIKSAMKRRQLTGELMRAELQSPNQESDEWKERLIANDVKQLKFSRESISTPSTNYSIEYIK